MHVPMEMDHVEEEDWEDVDKVRMGSTCYDCGMMEHFATDCRRKGKGKEKGGDGSKGYAKGKGMAMKAAGKRGWGLVLFLQNCVSVNSVAVWDEGLFLAGFVTVLCE